MEIAGKTTVTFGNGVSFVVEASSIQVMHDGTAEAQEAAALFPSGEIVGGTLRVVDWQARSAAVLFAVQEIEPDVAHIRCAPDARRRLTWALAEATVDFVEGLRQSKYVRGAAPR